MTTQEERRDLAQMAPFYVAGALTPDEMARFEAALTKDPELARNVAAARAERDEIVAQNEALPTPSARAFATLFRNIDAEPAPKPNLWRQLDIGGALARLMSPRALGWATAAACLLVALQAGLFLSERVTGPDASFSVAWGPEENARGAGVYALVSFTPGANMEAVSALLNQTGALIVEGPRAGGFYRLRLGGADLAPAEARRKIETLRQASALVRFAAPSP
jgi:anti-sigma-K factor RskA